jgi:hypothetical protein
MWCPCFLVKLTTLSELHQMRRVEEAGQVTAVTYLRFNPADDMPKTVKALIWHAGRKPDPGPPDVRTRLLGRALARLMKWNATKFAWMECYLKQTQKGSWRKQHSVELHKAILYQVLLYYAERRGQRVARTEDSRNAHNILVWKYTDETGKWPFGRLRCRGQDNIKMGLIKWMLEDVDWICLAQSTDRWLGPVNNVINFPVLKNLWSSRLGQQLLTSQELSYTEKVSSKRVYFVTRRFTLV